jgi:hypothetical protein
MLTIPIYLAVKTKQPRKFVLTLKSESWNACFLGGYPKLYPECTFIIQTYLFSDFKEPVQRYFFFHSVLRFPKNIFMPPLFLLPFQVWYSAGQCTLSVENQ